MFFSSNGQIRSTAKTRLIVEEVEPRCLLTCVTSQPADASASITLVNEVLLAISPATSSELMQWSMLLGEAKSPHFSEPFTLSAIGATTVYSGADAAESDPGFVFGWIGEYEEESGVLVRRMQDDATPLGPVIQVQAIAPETLGSYSADIRLAVLPDGEIVAVWTESTSLWGAKVACDGTVSPPLRLAAAGSTGSGFVEFDVQPIASADSGSAELVVVWGASESVWMQTFDAGFTPTSGPQPIASASRIDSLNLLPSDQADWVLKWTAEDRSLNWAQQLPFFNADGSPSLTGFSMTPGSEVAVLENGTFAVIDAVETPAGGELVIQRISATGEVDARVSVPRPADAEISSIQLVGTADGGFALSYLQSDQNGHAFVLHQFNAAGELVATLSPHAGLLPVDTGSLLVPLANGGVAFSWIGESLDGSSPTALTRSLRLASRTLEFQLAQRETQNNTQNDNHDGALLDWPDDYEVVLSGLPSQVIPSRGMRDAAGDWILPASDLHALQLQSEFDLPVLRISATLRSATMGEVGKQLTGTFGTGADDTIYPELLSQNMFLGAGVDTVELPLSISKVLVKPGPQMGSVSVVGPINLYTLHDAELLRFTDVLLTVEEAIALTSPPGQPATEDPPPTSTPPTAPSQPAPDEPGIPEAFPPSAFPPQDGPIQDGPASGVEPPPLDPFDDLRFDEQMLDDLGQAFHGPHGRHGTYGGGGSEHRGGMRGGDVFKDDGNFRSQRPGGPRSGGTNFDRFANPRRAENRFGSDGRGRIAPESYRFDPGDPGDPGDPQGADPLRDRAPWDSAPDSDSHPNDPFGRSRPDGNDPDNEPFRNAPRDRLGPPLDADSPDNFSEDQSDGEGALSRSEHPDARTQHGDARSDPPESLAERIGGFMPRADGNQDVDHRTDSEIAANAAWLSYAPHESPRIDRSMLGDSHSGPRRPDRVASLTPQRPHIPHTAITPNFATTTDSLRWALGAGRAESSPDGAFVVSPMAEELGRSGAAFDAALANAEITNYSAAIPADAQMQRVVIGSAVVAAVGCSLTQVLWVLRGGALITNMMATVPVWGGFDPLPILQSVRLDDADSEVDHETLLDIAMANKQ